EDTLGGAASLSPRRPRGRRAAEGRVVHAQIAADRAHDDLAGVQPDTDLHIHTVGAPRLLGIALNEVLHPQGRVAGPHRVIASGAPNSAMIPSPITRLT